MALQKQTMQLSITDGLDLKTDDKNVLPTRFTNLENVRFTKSMGLRKSNGFRLLNKNIFDTANEISDIQAATSFNDELLVYSDKNLYSFSDVQQEWIDKGEVQALTGSTESIFSGNQGKIKSSYTILENIGIYIVIDISFSGFKYFIRDEISKTILFTGSVAGLYDEPFVTVLGAKFFIFYRRTDTGGLYYRSISLGALNAITSEATITGLNTLAYTYRNIYNRIYIAYVKTVSGDIVVRYIDTNETLTAEKFVANSAAPTSAFIDLNPEGITNNIRINFAANAGGVDAPLQSFLYDYNLTITVHALVTIDPGIPPNTLIRRIAGIQNPQNENSSIVIYTVDTGTGAVTDLQIKVATIDSTGAVSAQSTKFYQSELNSKAFVYRDKVYFVATRFFTGTLPTITNVLLRTLFIVDYEGNIIGNFLRDTAIANTTLASVSRISNDFIVENNNLCYLANHITDVVTSNEINADAFSGGVIKCCLSFDQSINYFDSVLGQNLHTTGSILRAYDSNSIVEHGFLEIPRAPGFISTNAGVGIGIGSIQFVLVFEWRDQFGQTHRSAPSIPETYNNVGIVNGINIAIRPLIFTDKENVELVIYRTEPNGLTFYKVAELPAQRLFNVKQQANFVYNANTSDADLIDNEILYTDGGVLDNIAPESSSYITTYKNRLILILSDGKRFQYSKLVEDSSPVEFNDALIVTIDEKGGKLLAAQPMDDHLILFKERAIFAFTGEGPNNQGEQDDYRQPYLITTDTGLRDINSVVTTPMGLMFKSEKGIYLLKRNFSIEYIGDRMEEYNSNVVTSSTLLETTNEVRFTLDNNKVAVYDYYHNRWTTDVEVDAVDSLPFQNNFVYVRSDGFVYRESAEIWSNNGSYRPMLIESAWIQAAGIQNFQRFYALLLLGTYKNNHKIKVSFAYNFNPVYINDVIVDASDTYGTSIYGTGLYGTGVYGDVEKVYQLEIRPKIQKCQSFKFKIETIFDGVDGQDMEFSNINLTIGIKQGTMKNADGKVFGAS